MTPKPVAIMIHTAEPAAALGWYARAFPDAVLRRLHAPDFSYLQLGAVRLEIVASDEKVSSGPAGTVVYWSVADLGAALSRLQALGGTLYRGPMAIEDGLALCQVQDPWGNCIGLQGHLGAQDEPVRSP